MHRELPPEAQIKEVAVACRKRGGTQRHLPPGEQPHGRHRPRRSAPRIGDEYEWSVTFTCQTPDAAAASASRSACGLNLGWRQTPQGLLIATLTDSAGHLERIHLPEAILTRLDRAEALQGTLDTAANAIRARLAVWRGKPGRTPRTPGARWRPPRCAPIPTNPWPGWRWPGRIGTTARTGGRRIPARLPGRRRHPGKRPDAGNLAQGRQAAPPGDGGLAPPGAERAAEILREAGRTAGAGPRRDRTGPARPQAGRAARGGRRGTASFELSRPMLNVPAPPGQAF